MALVVEAGATGTGMTATRKNKECELFRVWFFLYEYQQSVFDLAFRVMARSEAREFDVKMYI